VSCYRVGFEEEKEEEEEEEEGQSSLPSLMNFYHA